MNRDSAVAALAKSQHGVVSLEQLEELGLEPGAVQKRARSGRLHRVHRGVYALAPPQLLRIEGHWLAAVLACGPGALLSHRSAADLHGLRATARRNTDVTVPGDSHRSHAGIDVHRSNTLAARDITIVRSIPATTVGRTELDLAGVIRQRQLERVLDQAEILHQFDLRDLQDQIVRSRTCPAAARLGATIAKHSPGRTPTWSELEDAFLALTRGEGLPDPIVNHFIVLGDGEAPIRVDFIWPDRRLVVETDGWETHRTRASFERDRHNDLRLSVAGYRPVRATWRAVIDRSGALASRVAALYRA